MKHFTTESMLDVYERLEQMTADLACGDPVEFAMTLHHRPDQGPPRRLADLCELADALHCHLEVLRVVAPLTYVRFTRMDCSHHLHDTKHGTETYGVNTAYGRINKLESPRFLLDLMRAYREVKAGSRTRVVNLGVNRGDEFALLNRLYPNNNAMRIGVDHCASAIDQARRRFDAQSHQFFVHDINALETLPLGRADLFMSLGTLHSPGIDSKRVFMWCMQNLVASDGAVIVGFPNCRWLDGVPMYGAKIKNRRESDLSLMIKDVYFVKKYLQQHKYNVQIFGKHYLFIVGVRIQRAGPG